MEVSPVQQGKGPLWVPVTARAPLLPSKYTGHPSYAYPRGRDYAEDRGYPGCGAFGERLYYPDIGGECPAKSRLYNIYPAAGPPIDMHCGAPPPIGYQTATTYN